MCLPGAAVLVRALEPTRGLGLMARRRGTDETRRLCAGPARLAEALAVTGAHDGAPLLARPLALRPLLREAPVVAGPRIGISRAVEQPWRFGLAGSSFLSRRFA